MSLVPIVAGTVAATNAADVGISGHILIAVAAAVLFGLIGLVPLLGGEPKAAPRPEWAVVDGAKEARPPVDSRLQNEGMTIDGVLREIEEPPRLAGGDPRWGRLVGAAS
ncbi:hypothetical protein ACR42A_12595 [Burkholderia gladioli]|uniref:hypothetical protein n=1 Tax=Burkholderia gladioli TaxID=28095 RepID=UPI001640E427|nr:hypothetical protein [Burkholderia gladioli]